MAGRRKQLPVSFSMSTDLDTHADTHAQTDGYAEPTMGEVVSANGTKSSCGRYSTCCRDEERRHSSFFSQEGMRGEASPRTSPRLQKETVDHKNRRYTRERVSEEYCLPSKHLDHDTMPLLIRRYTSPMDGILCGNEEYRLTTSSVKTLVSLMKRIESPFFPLDASHHTHSLLS